MILEKQTICFYAPARNSLLFYNAQTGFVAKSSNKIDHVQPETKSTVIWRLWVPILYVIRSTGATTDFMST
jgi:hypothetical protein